MGEDPRGGDEFCEVTVNALEGFCLLLRRWLRPHLKNLAGATAVAPWVLENDVKRIRIVRCHSITFRIRRWLNEKTKSNT